VTAFIPPEPEQLLIVVPVAKVRVPIRQRSAHGRL
jgi:hypothetical protein